ncbi:MAG: primosomal protein N' [Candidatus Sungbacteria bacterium]|nr:primosomal protein N' [Candidatus Sungbacteria bacterium]
MIFLLASVLPYNLLPQDLVSAIIRLAMFLIEVIPLARLPKSLPESFSYFHASSLATGVLVEIEISRQKLLGLVIKSSPVRHAKQNLRSASFTLKKIKKVLKEEPVFSSRDVEMLWWLSRYYLTSPGVILKMLIPSFITAGDINHWGARLESPAINIPRTEVIIGPGAIERYKSAVVETLARSEQVLVIAPEITKSETLFNEISGALTSDKIRNFSSVLPKKGLRETWHRIRTGESMAIVGTRAALFLPFINLGLVIIDDDGSPAHKSWDQAPKYHVRDVAKKLQAMHGSTLIMAGAPPSLSAYELVKDGGPNKRLVILPSPRTLAVSIFADMQKEIKEAKGFVIFSQVLKDKLRTLVHDAGRAFLFVNRKGFAPFILCQECGYIFKCTDCAVPLVYHTQESMSESTLLCHHCGAKQSPPDVCRECGSHRLKFYGIGVERVVKELKKMFPEMPIIPVSLGESKKADNIKLISDKLNKLSSYIAVGTEFAISGIELPTFDLAAVVSIDTALSLPDFAQNERLFRILSVVRALALKIFILQSFAKEPEVLSDLFHGSFEYFAEKELKERKKFNYPPYGELIKLTVNDTSREKALSRVKKLYSLLQVLEHQLGRGIVEITNPYPAYIEKKKGVFIFHILVKIISAGESLSAKRLIAETVPAEVLIDVGPESLL